MSKLPLNNGENAVIRDERGRIVKGSAAINPDGKPKGVKHLSTLLWEALQERAKNPDGSQSDKTHADLVVQRLLSDNIKYGKRTELIFDRIEGQAKQELDITTNGEKIEYGADVVAIARRVAEELKQKKTG